MVIDKKTSALLFPRIGKFSMAIFALLLIISGIRAFELFGFIFKESVKRDAIVLIPTGSDYKAVEDIFTRNDLVHNMKAFKWVAKKKDYTHMVKPGRYEIKKGWNTNQLINLLRIGEQSPVQVTFNNVRNFDDLAGKVSNYFETDSLILLTELMKEENPSKYGFSPATFQAMFIPNTYQFFWNTTPEAFVERMNIEYKKYWNNERTAKAQQLGMTPLEVATLASIVQEETAKTDEKARVAGVYINRLKRGMMLQADPTVKYATGDLTARRVTNDMLLAESPYNTYKVAGLPPGPINFPEITSIEAVLNAENHDFLYMCAKDDFSGYHNFARTISQHNINANKYRAALNRNKIWK